MRLLRDYRITKLTDDVLEFTLSGVDTSIANALRRIMIAEVSRFSSFSRPGAFRGDSHSNRERKHICPLRRLYCTQTRSDSHSPCQRRPLHRHRRLLHVLRTELRSVHRKAGYKCRLWRRASSVMHRRREQAHQRDEQGPHLPQPQLCAGPHYRLERGIAGGRGHSHRCSGTGPGPACGVRGHFGNHTPWS